MHPAIYVESSETWQWKYSYLGLGRLEQSFYALWIEGQLFSYNRNSQL